MVGAWKGKINSIPAFDYVKTNQLKEDDTIGRYAGASYEALGVNDTTSSNADIMYPNPMQDELFIKTNEASSVSIFTIEGRLIQNLDLTAETTYFSLTDYAAGTYLINLTNSKGKQTKKIIVN